MSTSPPDGTGPQAGWSALDPLQRRVLGVLIEKAKTTPAGYPMTLNAIVVGCNQKSNREPQMSVDDTDVANALRGLEQLKAVNEIDWMGRSSKYKHHAYEWMGVSKVELAVLAELLLRGEQTLGDLRARASRMEPIADLAALKPVVDGLLARGLMREVTPPGRGQLVTHGLLLPHEQAARAGRSADSLEPPSTPPPGAAAGPETPAAPQGLAMELAELREELAALTRRVARLEAERGPGTG